MVSNTCCSSGICLATNLKTSYHSERKHKLFRLLPGQPVRHVQSPRQYHPQPRLPAQLGHQAAREPVQAGRGQDVAQLRRDSAQLGDSPFGPAVGRDGDVDRAEAGHRFQQADDRDERSDDVDVPEFVEASEEVGAGADGRREQRSGDPASQSGAPESAKADIKFLFYWWWCCTK
jgi:hypothetical protein